MLNKNAKKPVLVLGIGNILLRDEGVGVHIVKAMENIELPSFVELMDGGTAGADLLDCVSDRQKLIVIDALDADVSPGTILRLKPDDLIDSPTGISLHEFGLSQTLTAAKFLNCAPLDVTIIAIKPQDLSPGLSLSPLISHLIPKIIEAVLDEILTPVSKII